MNYFFEPSMIAAPVLGDQRLFPVHRIYCVGRNYEDHAKEMGDSGREPPFFFMKPADSLVIVSQSNNEKNPADLPYPSLTQNFHHEVELVVAIGLSGKNIAVENAHQHIFGYAVGLDMTRRDLQSSMKKQGHPWDISKGFDASAPIGLITPKNQLPSIQDAQIELKVNGETRQKGQIAQMIWNISETISHLSKAWELKAGDLIYTGTPAGVSAVVVGDLIQARISGLSPIDLRVC